MPAAPTAPAPGADHGLDTWPTGMAARVAGLAPAPRAAEQALRLRLLEIGFLPGEPVRIVARGPAGGEPLAVRIGRSTFALRRHEAALVRVQADAAPEAACAH